MYHRAGEQYLNEHAEVIETEDYRVDNLCTLVKNVDGIVLRGPAKITKEVIDANPNLKVISGAGVGLDNIDVDYATRKGIPVVHAPSINKVSTAEHTVALLMALSKSLIPFHEKMKEGDFSARNTIPTYELKGKTIGLIGFGNIAKEVAKRLSFGFEMNVKAWVRRVDEEKIKMAKALNVEVTDRIEEVFSQSDYVSVHLPLTNDTRYLIDQSMLSLMKSSSYLINTARGAIINQEDLYKALVDKTIAGAALDVFDPEPPLKDQPILSLPNVILTPHIGGITEECNYISSKLIAENVIAILNGKEPKYLANPEVFRHHLS